MQVRDGEVFDCAEDGADSNEHTTCIQRHQHIRDIGTSPIVSEDAALGAGALVFGCKKDLYGHNPQLHYQRCFEESFTDVSGGVVIGGEVACCAVCGQCFDDGGEGQEEG